MVSRSVYDFVTDFKIIVDSPRGEGRRRRSGGPNSVITSLRLRLLVVIVVYIGLIILNSVICVCYFIIFQVSNVSC